MNQIEYQKSVVREEMTKKEQEQMTIHLSQISALWRKEKKEA